MRLNKNCLVTTFDAFIDDFLRCNVAISAIFGQILQKFRLNVIRYGGTFYMMNNEKNVLCFNEYFDDVLHIVFF